MRAQKWQPRLFGGKFLCVTGVANSINKTPFKVLVVVSLLLVVCEGKILENLNVFAKMLRV